MTDGNGMASYYIKAGNYTICYYSPQIAGLQIVMLDQIVAPPTSTTQYNSDASEEGLLQVSSTELMSRLLQAFYLRFDFGN
jgi:hypothetical protein